MPTSNDIAWQNYITSLQIKLDGNSYIVPAKELKEIAKREPRLLAKIDDRERLPTIFRNAGYSLLAITNGSYLIFKGSIFADIPACTLKKQYMPVLDFPLRTFGRGTGESEYVDYAFNTGLLSEFTNSGKLYLTIRGRERTSNFNFMIGADNKNIQVAGVQIDVDAGYEGERDVILVEAKIGDRNNFNVRQLYYPFRHFTELVTGKEIRPIFLSYDISRSRYSFYEFGFKDKNRFDSIYLINSSAYSLVHSLTCKVDELLDSDFENETNVVPQADDFNKILELLMLINSGQNTVLDIADHFVFDSRQSNYYGEAAEYLGLLTRRRGVFELSRKGAQLISTQPSQQQLYLTKLVINSWVFKDLVKRGKQNGYFTVADISDVISSARTHSGEQRYTQSTIGRRRSTNVSWAKWLSEQFECFSFDVDRFVLK